MYFTYNIYNISSIIYTSYFNYIIYIIYQITQIHERLKSAEKRPPTPCHTLSWSVCAKKTKDTEHWFTQIDKRMKSAEKRRTLYTDFPLCVCARAWLYISHTHTHTHVLRTVARQLHGKRPSPYHTYTGLFFFALLFLLTHNCRVRTLR